MYVGFGRYLLEVLVGRSAVGQVGGWGTVGGSSWVGSKAKKNETGCRAGRT